MEADEYNKIFNFLSDGSFSTDTTDNEKRRIRKRSSTFVIKENELYYTGGKKNNEKSKLVITSVKKHSILKLCHDDNGCHLGMEKTFYKITERYYWKGMTQDVKDYIRKCEECQKCNKKTKTMHPELQPVPIPSGTWKKIGIDLIGPFNNTNGQPMSENGYRYVLTIIDYFSSYLEAFPLKRKLATEVAEKLFELFCRQGVPLELVSDNGGEFNSCLSKSIKDQYGYKHILITPYHPQANGKCERVNQSLKSMLNKKIRDNEATWEQILPQCVFAYNTARQSSTKYSPFYLMYWRNPILPNENAFGETANTLQKYVEIPNDEIEKTVENMTNIQKQITQDVIDNVGAAQQKQKADFDKRHEVAKNEFKEGDKVLLKNMKRKKTLGKQRWLGPYLISKIPKIGTMTLSDDKNQKIIGNYRQHNLKRYHETSDSTILDDPDQEEEANNDSNVIISEKVHEDDDTCDNGEKVSESSMNENEDVHDDDIFLTQSTFNAQAEIHFDIDVDEMIMSESTNENDDNPEPRPKRNCQKDRRNSLYEYYPIVKKTKNMNDM